MSKFLKEVSALDVVEAQMGIQLDSCKAPLDLLENTDLFYCSSPMERLAVEHVISYGGPRVYVPVHRHMFSDPPELCPHSLVNVFYVMCCQKFVVVS